MNGLLCSSCGKDCADADHVVVKEWMFCAAETPEVGFIKGCDKDDEMRVKGVEPIDAILHLTCISNYCDGVMLDFRRRLKEGV